MGSLSMGLSYQGGDKIGDVIIGFVDSDNARSIRSLCLVIFFTGFGEVVGWEATCKWEMLSL